MLRLCWPRQISRFSPANPFLWSSRTLSSSNVPPLTQTSAQWNHLTEAAQEYVRNKFALCGPKELHICDGSARENEMLLDYLVKRRTIEKLTHSNFENCYLARTDSKDIARVEGKTFVCTKNKSDTVSPVKFGASASLGNWMSEESMDFLLEHKRFPSSMDGRTMYVIPFSMGPVGSPLSKIGIQLTDSPYVVCSMRIMTRMGQAVLDHMKKSDSDFVKCLHSLGRSQGMLDSWPCDPDNTVIAHFPNRNEICSYGSGYGGNSLLGKKCLALRIASTLARKEGWLAEHMLILGLTNPEGRKKYIAAAFPSACGKTNLAMMRPSIPGWKVECVGDDIAWMRFDSNGVLRAINPESGFFGVAPGTSMKTNPYCLNAVRKNTIFTNVASTNVDGQTGIFWEGLEDEVNPEDENIRIAAWNGIRYNPNSDFPGLAAHKNSRFCTPASQLEIIDPAWENPEGVPIDAILFGGRRPSTIPLVYESFDWTHGVFVGASMRSMATAASIEGSATSRPVHDPFAMKPFFGYSFGKYVHHWLSLQDKPGVKLPKIFHVNWFRTERRRHPHAEEMKEVFLWPGFGDNSRVLEWVFRRTDNEDVARSSAIGYMPKHGSLNVNGLDELTADTIEKLFMLPKSEWQEETKKIREFFLNQVGDDMPQEIWSQLDALEQRIEAM